ncbi:MAG: phosphate acetyltransferase [Epsilonproteobacteria bacterium]|nr:MAG: phosphate acetyltransferase [Campylobacterota bacterium]
MYPKSIYISSTQSAAGSLIVSIGFMEMLKGHYERVAFFRPIIPDGKEKENDIDFMLKHFELDMSYDACCGFKLREYTKAHAENKEEALYEALLHKVNQLRKEYDFILIEGFPRSVFDSIFDFDINLKIARNLSTVFVPILNAKNKTFQKIINELQIVSEVIQDEGCTHLATFINRCDESELAKVKMHIENKQNQIYLLPERKELNMPTLNQIIKLLKAEVLMGSPEQLQHLIYGNKIAAMGVDNYLTHINNGDIVIIPGDRVDIIFASLLSFYTKNHPNIAGIILSGDITPSKNIMKLLEDFGKIPIPILKVKNDSYQTAIALDKIIPAITVDSLRKITIAKGLFDAAVDKDTLRKRFQGSPKEILTPMMFQYRLFEQARTYRQKIVLPESMDERILKAADILIGRDVVDIIFIGNQKAIENQSIQMGLDLSKAKIYDPQKSELVEKFSQTFYSMRKEKGLTLDAARDAMIHPNYFATMMVLEGLADGMVSGATHTTTDTVRPALQIIKTNPNTSIVSSVFFMCLDTKVLVYGDCAINLDPDAKALAQIAISSAETAAKFGIEPRVAMLSYSTGTSGSGPEVDKVREATKLAQVMRPDLLIEGPIQYDAAIDENVAKKKLPNSKVAGRATVFVFPDLNTGNNTYKAVQRSTGALAIGPVLQGLRLPVNDLSRGCLVDDVVNTVVITAIQAQKVNAK